MDECDFNIVANFFLSQNIKETEKTKAWPQSEFEYP